MTAVLFKLSSLRLPYIPENSITQRPGELGDKQFLYHISPSCQLIMLWCKVPGPGVHSPFSMGGGDGGGVSPVKEEVQYTLEMACRILAFTLPGAVTWRRSLNPKSRLPCLSWGETLVEWPLCAGHCTVCLAWVILFDCDGTLGSRF